MSVSIVDYGLGNLGSVANMLKRIGTEVRFVSNPDEVAASDRVLLPGVGSFDHGVHELQVRGLDVALREFASKGKPLLGICLGMQLLADSSEEGVEGGLGLIAGRSRRFTPMPKLRVPHMGWSAIHAARDSELLAEVPEDNRFYFVHSYHLVPQAKDAILAVSHYGEEFVSVVQKENVMGAQFHPEKSHDFGKRLLTSFAAA